MFHLLNGRFDDAPRQDNVPLFFTGLSYSLHLHSSTHTSQSIWIYICSQSRSGAITFRIEPDFLTTPCDGDEFQKPQIESKRVILWFKYMFLTLISRRKEHTFSDSSWNNGINSVKAICCFVRRQKKRSPIEEFQPWTKWYQTIFKSAPTIYTSQYQIGTTNHIQAWHYGRTGKNFIKTNLIFVVHNEWKILPFTKQISTKITWTKKLQTFLGPFFGFLFVKLVFFCRIKWRREKKYLIFVMQ